MIWPLGWTPSSSRNVGHRLTVAARLKSGSPYNDVQWTSSPAGIDCWTSCAATFPSGTVVTLYTTEMPSSWGGDCSLHQSLTMDGDKTCIAIFNNYLGPIRLGAQTSSAVESAGLGAAVVTTSMDTPTALQVVEYYHLDAIGSVRAVTDADGNVIARHDFRPFGEELAPQTPPKDRKLFTGQERDFETGLDYFYARQLRVDLGRFTTPDPLTDLAWTDPTLGATNAYGYVNNNPLRYIDPTGMTPGLVHVNCTGVEACSQISSIWASANGYCVAADGGGLDCVRPSYIVQVTAPENSSVTQPLTPMGAGVLSFYPGRGPDDLPVGFQKDPPQTRIGPYVPPQPQRPTSMSNCMYSELVDSFFGDSDKTFLSVGLHVATAVALRGGKDAVAAFLPGPGWLYAAIALTYDAGKIAGAWVNCQGGQR